MRGHEIRWDHWRFRYALHPREGLVLYTVAYGGESDFASYIGKDLTPKDLCRLHGTWIAHHG